MQSKGNKDAMNIYWLDEELPLKIIKFLLNIGSYWVKVAYYSFIRVQEVYTINVQI